LPELFDPQRPRVQEIEIGPAKRKCLHYYFYYVDRAFGPMHVRLESWLPFSAQVYVNGREYLARRLERAGISFEKHDNCFTRVSDLKRAQDMLDDLVSRRWERFLNMLARRVNPLLDARSGLELQGYYWTIRQSEVATDVIFQDAATLEAVYPRLLRHAIEEFRCQDVLRFLGRRLTKSKTEEVTSELRELVEGVRIKHRFGENSIKMYDKQGNVLRIETTIKKTAAVSGCSGDDPRWPASLGMAAHAEGAGRHCPARGDQSRRESALSGGAGGGGGTFAHQGDPRPAGPASPEGRPVVPSIAADRTGG
jgi:hypothetical protein